MQRRTFGATVMLLSGMTAHLSSRKPNIPTRLPFALPAYPTACASHSSTACGWLLACRAHGWLRIIRWYGGRRMVVRDQRDTVKHAA